MSDDRPDTSPTADLGLQLAQLADLHGQGVLSDEEFSAAKQRIIGEKPTRQTAEPPAPKTTPGPFDETGHLIVTEKPGAKKTSSKFGWPMNVGLAAGAITFVNSASRWPNPVPYTHLVGSLVEGASGYVAVGGICLLVRAGVRKMQT